MLESFKRVIAYTIDATTEFDVVRQNRSVEIRSTLNYLRFAWLIQLLLDHRSGLNGVSIITFNYDIALDFALRTRGVSPDYCLSVKHAEPVHIKLLKLHGSVNWGRQTESRDIVFLERLEHIATTQAQHISNEEKTNLPVGIDLSAIIKDQFRIDIDPSLVIVPPGF